jgi:hypothetical protein
MSTLFGLTNYAEIVSQLGIDTSEYKEGEFNSSGIVDELQLDLTQWFSKYQALSDDTSTDADIVAQKLALKIYSKVFCAEQIAITSPMRFVQQEGDGDNTTKRFQNANSLKNFRDDLYAKRSDMKAAALSYTTAHSPAAVAVTVSTNFMASASPATDKITG